MFIFSIRDEKSHTYEGLMLYESMEVAKRAVTASFSPTSLLCLYPSDYRLAIIGKFDIGSGVIEPSFINSVDIVDLIPDKFKSLALDGSFTNRSSVAGESE